MNVIWTEPALNDVDHLSDYIAMDQPVYAQDFTERLMASVEPAAEFPRMFRAVPEANAENIREVIFHGYRIIFRVVDITATIQVLAVVHGSRDLSNPATHPWDVH